MFEIKSGMRVKLSNDLSKSIGKYGGYGAKLSIQGTVQEVQDVFGTSITVKIDSGIYRGVWTISKSDVIEPSIKPVKVKPELFNPENLI